MGERLTAERVAELRRLLALFEADPCDVAADIAVGDAAQDALPDLLDALAERDAEIARLRQERQRLRGVIISAAARLARGELSLSDDPLDHGVKRMPARVEKAIRRQQDEHRDIAVNLAEHARAGDKHNP
jgi:hypothetical protein